MPTGISPLVVCGCAATACAREEIKRDFQKTVALPAGRGLRVVHSLGSVNVRTQAKREVSVQAEIRCSADRAVTATDVTGALDLSNRFGDTRVSNAGGGITVRSANGRVEVDRVTGPTQISDSFGDVRVTGAQSDVTDRIKTARWRPPTWRALPICARLLERSSSRALARM